MEFDINRIMNELENLENEQTKRTYIRHGAKEPLYGVRTEELKPLAKKIKKNYDLSIKLYETGNYDAMYLAGMIAEPLKMTRLDFENWIEEAYCSGLADYTVAVTLAKSLLAQEIADDWIKSNKELYASAGWSCYAWLISYLPDDELNKQKIQNYLEEIEKTIHSKPNHVRYAMNNFVIAVGISYKPLHEKAIEVVKSMGEVFVDMGETNCKTPLATEYIQKAIDKNRLGLKRKNERI